MLKINLLPEAGRKAGLSSLEQFHRTPLMWLAVAVMVALPLILLVPMQVRRQQLQQLEGKIQVLEPKKTELEQLQKFLQQLRQQETAFRALAKGQNLWSKRLNTLSDATPDGLWFTELALDPTKGLVIQGSAIGQVGPEMLSVTRLVQGLKESADFASAFKDIQIESIKRVQDGDIDIVQFTLTCTPAEAPAS